MDALLLATWTSDSHCSYHGNNALYVQVSLSHDHRLLFTPTSVVLPCGACTGLVGTNGSGKSSFARVLPHLPGFPSHWVVQYVASEDILLAEDEDDEITPIEFLRGMVEEWLSGIRQRIQQLEEEEPTEENHLEQVALELAELCQQEEEYLESSEREMEEMIQSLGMQPHLHKTLHQLSSGWRYKCRLMAAFLVHPDLLILDEPSFLDATSTEWLIERTRDRLAESSIVLLISHKEAVLDALCDQILYLNSENHTLSSFHCGYHDFRDLLETQRASAQRTTAEAARQHTKAESSLQNIQKQLKHREANFKSRTSQNADQRFIKGKNKEAKQKADRSAASKVKQLEKQTHDMEALLQQNRKERVRPLQLEGTVASGPLVTMQDVSVAFDQETEPLFQNVEAQLGPTDRILLLGPNGVGKSTLIQIMLGQLEPTAGHVARQGTALYFPQYALQELCRRHGSQTAMDYLDEEGSMTQTAARLHLGSFGLAKDLALRKILTLSSGQRVRLWLAKQVLHHPKPSLLILDEMSENVDIETRDSLLDLLNHFVGAAVVVSHDHDFTAAFSPTARWTLTPIGIRIEYPDPTI